jgi:hypothetical protein
VFVPTFAQKFLIKHKYINKNKIRYLFLNGFFRENLNFNINITKPLPDLINVILSCLIVAKYMGFREIYLIGCDHNWLGLRDQKKYQRFFPKDYLEEVDYRNTYESSALAVSQLFKAYRLLKHKLLPTKIYNCTPGSFIDIFDFKKLSQIL